MTEPQSNQQPYQGISGPGEPYSQPQGANPVGSQNPYGQQQYSGANPPGQPQQNPYEQQGYAGQPQNPYGAGGSSNYGPAPKRRNVGMIVRVVGVVAVLAIGGIGYGVSKSHQSGRGSDGTINKQGNLDAFSIKVNDCFENPTDAITGFDSVKAIPCDQPHTAQAFFTFDYPNAPAAEPSDDDMSKIAEQQCGDALKTKVDESKLPQSYQPSYLFPDSTAWTQGHHDIMCIVADDTNFTGSAVKA